MTDIMDHDLLDVDDDVLEARPVSFRTEAARRAVSAPDPEAELVPGKSRRRRVRVTTAAEISAEARRIYASIARGDVSAIDGGRRLRSLKILAETTSSTEIERRLETIVLALKRGGLLR